MRVVQARFHCVGVQFTCWGVVVPLVNAIFKRFVYVFFFFLQLSQLTKEDVVALAKSIDGFLSSDIGKMAQMVVFAAFPKMKIPTDVAMPILRHFIKKVTLLQLYLTFFPFGISIWRHSKCSHTALKHNFYLNSILRVL